MAKKPKTDLDLNIDLGAALDTGTASPDLARPATASQATPKRPRGRPRTKPPANPNRTRKVRSDKGKPKGSTKDSKKTSSQTPYIDNNIILDDNKNILGDYINKIDDMEKGEIKSAINLKSIITQKEAKFIELYCTGEHTTEQAMILAGYEGYSQSGLYYIAGKIKNKIESQAEDHRKLFRQLGAGETLVIKTLFSLIKTSKNELIRLNATSQLAKILGLTKEQIDGAGGITIIFEGSGETRTLPGAPPYQAQAQSAALPVSTKPLMITK